jgi:hypothetical protein
VDRERFRIEIMSKEKEDKEGFRYLSTRDGTFARFIAKRSNRKGFRERKRESNKRGF